MSDHCPWPNHSTAPLLRVCVILFLGSLNLPGLVRDLPSQAPDPSTASFPTTKRLRAFHTGYRFGWARFLPLATHHYHRLRSTETQTANLPRRASTWVGSTAPPSCPRRHHSFTHNTFGDFRRRGPYRDTIDFFSAPKPSSNLFQPTRSPPIR